MPKLTTPKKNGKKAAKKVEREIFYPELDIRLFHHDPVVMEKFSGVAEAQPLTVKVAKEMLGWMEDDTTFGDDYLLMDRYGKKVRLMNNLTNRPFYPEQADALALEILRRKWKFNGETLIIDKRGMNQDSQHRLSGLVLAAQDWERDGKAGGMKWGTYWVEEPWIDALVVFGIEDDDETINTIGTGKPRSLKDALYRWEWFSKQKPKDREPLAKLSEGAIKFLWKRTKAAQRSEAPKRPHSESFEYLQKHLTLLECVKFIYEEGDGKKLSPFLPLGTAAALLYLMSVSASDSEQYDADGTEKTLDFKFKDQAQEFFVLFCSKAAKLEPLHKVLEEIPVEAGGSYAADLRVGLFIKAWNRFVEGEELYEDQLKLEHGENTLGQPVLSERPYIGGIDLDRDDLEPEVTTAPEAPENGEEQPEVVFEPAAHKLSKDAKGRWWIVPKKGSGKEYGPYDNKKLAEDARVGGKV